MEKMGFVPMVIWRVIEILLKFVRLRTFPEGDAAHREQDRLRVFSIVIRIEETIRKWRAAVRFRLKEGAGSCEIEKRIAKPPLGSLLLPLPNGVARFF